MVDVYAALVNGATMSAFLKMARAMGDEDGHPLDAGGEAAVRALAAGDPFARAWLFRASPEGPVVGYVVLTFGFSIEYGGRDCFIDELYVVPDARGQGIGTAALEFATEEARKLGIKALHLEVMRGNNGALELYRRHGFAEVDRHLMNKWL
jgi:ribosomal protein S18 acetylase RimI-like enzyme